MIQRSSGLTRRTSLSRGTAGLSRSAFRPPAAPVALQAAALAPRPGLRPRSKKTAAKYVTRVQVVADLLERFKWCQIKWDGDCEGRSTDVHEPGMRSRGADICNPDECVTGCRHCHNQVHANPAEATRRGWMIPSGRPSKAVARG
jgi:hypothetical protein